MPPSPGYTWVNGCDFSALPTRPDDVRPPERCLERSPVKNPEADLRLIAAALAVIPNDDLSWDDWNRIGMATWRATGGSDDGLAAFDAWSRKSNKYDADATAERWRHYFRSPPDEIGAGTLFHEADQVKADWQTNYFLASMNAEYAVVRDGGKTRVLSFDREQQRRGNKVVHTRLVPTFQAFEDFRNYHLGERVTDENGKQIPVGHWWLKHPKRP